MNKDRIEGKVKDIAGRVERQAGEWTGDPKKQIEGAVKQAEGKVQGAWGKAKDAVRNESTVTKSQQQAGDDDTEESIPVRQ